MICTAHTGTNSELLDKILSLYSSEEATIADLAYGKGAFWRNTLRQPDVKCDIAANRGVSVVADCRNLPFKAESLDVSTSERRSMRKKRRHSMRSISLLFPGIQISAEIDVWGEVHAMFWETGNNLRLASAVLSPYDLREIGEAFIKLSETATKEGIQQWIRHSEAKRR